MEIEVEEYVRTKNGKIDKIINNNCYMPQYIECEKSLVYKEDIVNHSKDIIDLIEVGDIVNKGYIYETGNTEDGHKWVHNLNGLLLFNDDIKTILTKEQYMQNCYTVERKE